MYLSLWVGNKMGFVRIAIIVLITAIALHWIPSLLKAKLPTNVKGFAAPGWEAVGEVFKKHVEQGLEKGGAFAVYHKGELVVDFYGGYADEEAEWAWDKDTVTCVFSSTKGVSAVVAAMLVDRGLMKYDQTIASFWPEFAQNGKEKITVRHILSHTAGLAILEEPFSMGDILHNPDKVSRVLAMQKPTWEPGTEHGYHGLSVAMYIDQFVRRLDPKKRDLQQFFQQEIAKPFGIDFFMGLPREENYRCARLYQGSILDAVVDRNFEVFRMMLNFMVGAGEMGKMAVNPKFKIEWLNKPDEREIPCGSSHGHSTARGLAKIYAILANGGTLGGKRLLSKKVIQEMIVPQASGSDRMLLFNITYAHGVNLFPNKAGTPMFGTPGAGGNMGFADMDKNIAWAYVTNHHRVILPGADPRVEPLKDAAYDIIIRQSKRHDK